MTTPEASPLPEQVFRRVGNFPETSFGSHGASREGLPTSRAPLNADLKPPTADIHMFTLELSPALRGCLGNLASQLRRKGGAGNDPETIDSAFRARKRTSLHGQEKDIKTFSRSAQPTNKPATNRAGCKWRGLGARAHTRCTLFNGTLRRRCAVRGRGARPRNTMTVGKRIAASAVQRFPNVVSYPRDAPLLWYFRTKRCVTKRGFCNAPRQAHNVKRSRGPNSHPILRFVPHFLRLPQAYND
jgi:hypothetical protein